MKRIALLAVVALATLAAQAAPSHAAAHRQASVKAPAKQPVVTGFFRDREIHYFDYGPIKLKAGNKLAPIWAVTNGADGQHNIVDTVPGRSDYSPLWQVSMVTWKAGVTPRLLKSTAEVMAAQQSGDVTIEKTTTVVNCPVLGFGQKRITGFSNGHKIHYFDLGPLKVRPGNATAPLYAPMNGVAGQHNIALENVAVGQTKYPPLWAIIAVFWKPGAHKALLTSAKQIKALAAKGELTVKKTSLIVNCPVVA